MQPILCRDCGTPIVEQAADQEMVFLRIPHKAKECHPDPNRRAQDASQNPSVDTDSEIESLTLLTETECPYTPKLLSVLRKEQDPTMWIPGGWLIFLLMEKLPGVHPFDLFTSMTRAQRDELRAGFKKALSAVYERGLEPYDCKLGNILWDAQTKTCYIIDFESVDDHRDDPWPLIFRDYQYASWQLTRLSRSRPRVEECYIIDFESVDDHRDDGQVFEFNDYDYARWKLTRLIEDRPRVEECYIIDFERVDDHRDDGQVLKFDDYDYASWQLTRLGRGRPQVEEW